jgi:hypothetical protein
MTTEFTNWGIRRWKRTVSRPRLLAILATVVLWVYSFVLRPWHLRWGATDEEVSKPLLGDAAAPEKEYDPGSGSTRAITVHAPVEVVVAETWSWLGQMPGQDRRGFYKYEWFRDLSGVPELRDAERRHPEWQHRVTGQAVWLFPATKFKLAAFDPGKAIMLEGWGTVAVEPMDENSTRVIIRSRVMRRASGLYYRLFYHPLVAELPHFLIERRMLKGIKEQAERVQTSKFTELS